MSNESILNFNSESVLKFIRVTGFRTLKEIHDQYKKEDQEILEAILISLTTRNNLRRVLYQSPDGPSSLYHIIAL